MNRLLHSPLRPVSALLVAALVAAPLGAAPLPVQKSDAQIADDIEFAMGLAEEWGYVDLAADVIQRIEDAGVPAQTRERLGLAKCDVFATGAFNEPSVTRRLELFEEALSAYQSFIEENSRSEKLPEAEQGYVRVADAFSRTLEIAQEEVVGEEAEALRERRVVVLTDAVSKTGELIDVMQSEAETSAQKQRELVNMMLMRGRMLIALGQSQDAGQFAFDQAYTTLENVVYVAGEGSPGALQAYELLGRLFMAQDDPQTAYAFFEAVVNQAIPANQEDWERLVQDQELDQSAKDQRWLFVQLGTAGLLDSLLAAGEVETANKYALHFHNTLKREGFQIERGFGYEAYLAVARCLLDSGGWIGGNWVAGQAEWFPDEEALKDARHSPRNRATAAERALQIAQQINRENRGNRMQVRAQRLIGRIIERPGVEVDPSVLYEAAEGVYNEQEYAEAIRDFKRLLRVLDAEDTATRAEFMPKTLYRLGRAYVRLDRDLEAAMAFREGCTTWQGDPEYDTFNARSFFELSKRLSAVADESPVVNELYAEAENLAERFASQSDQDEIKWNKAEKHYRDDEWDQAIAKYREISPSSNYAERAMVRIAAATYRSGDVEQGEELFRAYLEDFLNDPVESAIGDSEIKAAMRKVARASAEFFYALAAFERAKDARAAYEEGGRTTPPEPALWEEVVERVGDYPDEFRDQDSTAPWTMYMYLTAKLQLEELDAAADMYEKMLARYESNRFTAAAAIDMYKRLGTLQEAAESPERERELEREMAALLKASNSVGKPSYNRLRNESNHWTALGEWAEAERVLRRLRKNFGEGELAETITKYIVPDLAHALLEQHEVAEAYDLLDPLVEAGGQSRKTVMDWMRAVTGWVDGAEPPFTIVPGVGSDAEEFDEVVGMLTAMLNASDVDKWGCEGYYLRFRQAWTYYAWATAEGGPQDSSKRGAAQRRISPLVSKPEIGRDFEGIDERCNENSELAPELGDGVLQRRFQWLWEKVENAS